MKITTFFVVLTAVGLTSGCASFGKSLRNLIGGKEETPQRHAASGKQMSFMDQPTVMLGKQRKYKRVTSENFDDGEGIEENSGSLWKKEGQGSFLFSQNNLRVMGDIVNLEIEGKAAENLSTKLKIIKAAIARRYAPTRLPARASAVGSVPKPAGEGENATPAASPNPQAESTAEKPQTETANTDVQSKFDSVSCRIVEKNKDGSYRVKGQQTIYVGSFEYKLIVTGIVRPDDIAMDQIKSSQLIDSKYDLVASNKEAPSREPR